MDLWPVLSDLSQIDWCEPFAKKLKKVWLKVDTGMHRLGMPPADLAKARQILNKMGVNDLVAMSHFASGEFPNDPLTVS